MSGERLSPEHGGRTAHKSWVQFRVRYPVLALLFVAFDMEMVYMFPWAVVFKRVGLAAFLDMFGRTEGSRIHGGCAHAAGGLAG